VIIIKPTSGLTGNAVITLPAGGRAVIGVGDQIKQFDLPAGGRVVAATDGTITLPDISTDLPPQAPIPDSGTTQDSLSAAAAINHSTSAPVNLNAGDYSVTIDPDLRGEGVLGIKSLSRLLTGTPFADVMAACRCSWSAAGSLI
jgi:hypothetical protein